MGRRGGRLRVGKQRGRQGCPGTFPSQCSSPRQWSSPSHPRLSALVRFLPLASCVAHILSAIYPFSPPLGIFLLYTVPIAFPPTTFLRVHGQGTEFETDAVTGFSGTGTGQEATHALRRSGHPSCPPRSFSGSVQPFSVAHSC